MSERDEDTFMLTEHRENARVAVIRDGERIERDWEEFKIQSGDDSITNTDDKYEFSLEDDEVTHWKVYDLPIAEIEGEEKKSELTLVIEVSEPLPESIGKISIDVDAVAPATVNNVAGLDEQKRELLDFLEVSDEDWGMTEPTGIILEGPPGTGKTELVREVCEELYGSIPVMISGPEILNKWVGGSERLLRQKFEEAWNSQARVLYIDELDAIAQSRDDVSESYGAQIVAQLLVLLDGVEAKARSEQDDRPLKVIASTNLSHVVDPALKRPGRLGNRPITFGYPDEGQRKAILHHYLEVIRTSSDGGEKLSDDLVAAVEDKDLTPIEELSTLTDGSTGADIEDLVRTTVRKFRDTDDEDITQKFIESVYDEKNFQSQWTVSECEIKTPRGPVDLASKTDGTGLGVYVTHDESEAREIARTHFAERDTDDRVDTYIFRKITPTDILDGDEAIAKERILQAFQHDNDERVALYLERAKAFDEVRPRSALVDRLTGLINEQLLQWDESNVLILSEGGDGIVGYEVHE